MVVAIASPSLVAGVQFGIAIAAATAALSGSQDCVEAMRREFCERYQYFRNALNELPGVDCPDCEGAFYAFPSFQGFIDQIDSINDDDFFHDLLDKELAKEENLFSKVRLVK
mgnify:CR=1 FL=1